MHSLSRPHLQPPGHMAACAPCEREGLATRYGRVQERRQTSSSERFSAAALTAGHCTLPFGTMVRVMVRVEVLAPTVWQAGGQKPWG
jgi:hypothetical protein